jgi:hypothetical protein
MRILERPVLSAIKRLNRAGLTFGLGSAVIISVLGLAIAGAVAYYYAG